MTLQGVGAVRMDAMVFARDGKSRQELAAFLHKRFSITRQRLTILLQGLGINEEKGKLCLPTNVVPMWWGVVAWTETDQQQRNEKAWQAKPVQFGACE